MAPTPEHLFDVSSETRSLERLIEAPRPPSGGLRRRFLLFLALCLALHIALVAALLIFDMFFVPVEPVSSEIPVEVVVEPPAPPPAEPPAPQEEKKPEEQKKEEPQQKPKQQLTIEEEPAFDAPRAENKEKLEREAPDDSSKATRVAPPTDQVAPQPSPEKTENAPPESAPEAAEEKLQKPSEEKPDAEVIERGEEKLNKPEEKQAAKTKAPPKKGAKSIADQLASLEQLPEYKLGGAAKPSPVSGGQAKTTYLTILYGMIMPHMHVPIRVRSGHLQGRGVVAFYIDERGNLTHQAVYRTSGLPDLDAAAVDAVRRAAPFPAPPQGLPHAIQFTYSTK